MINTKYLDSLIKPLRFFSKKFSFFKNDKKNIVVFSFLFMIIASIVFSYNSSLKKKEVRKYRIVPFKQSNHIIKKLLTKSTEIPIY